MRYCPRCGIETAALTCPTDGTPTVRQVTQNRKELGAGDVIGGRYRVLGKLGHGGFGTVFDTVHTTTGHPVAVKVLSPLVIGETQEMARRFFQEASTTSRLTHPNTVRVFDFGQTDTGELFLAMERLSGETLQALLSRVRDQGDTLSEAQTVDIAVAVLRSLGEAHALGLVHRDMKPANIFLHEMAGGEATVKVLDFGIVKTGDASMTQAGKALGTPTHMSPEQAMGRDINGRSDLYSLGVMLYECLTGSLPFESENPLTVVMKHVTELPEPIAQRAPGKVRPALAQAVERTLLKKPEDRFQTAQEMRKALEDAIGTPAQTGLYRIAQPVGSRLAAQSLTPAPTPLPTPIGQSVLARAQPAPSMAPTQGLRPVVSQSNSNSSVLTGAATMVQPVEQIRAHREQYLRHSGGIFEVGTAIGSQEEEPEDRGAMMPQAPRMDSRVRPVSFGSSAGHDVNRDADREGRRPRPGDLGGWGGLSQLSALSGAFTAGLPFAHPAGGSPFANPAGGSAFDTLAHLTRPLPVSQQPARRQIEAMYLAGDLQHAVYADPQHQLHSVDLGPLGAQPVSVLDLSDWIEVGGHEAPVEAIASSSDGRLIASASMDGLVRVWDSTAGCRIGELELESQPSCLAISADAKLLVVGCGDGSVGLYELSSLQLRRTLRGHREAITAVACAGSKRLVVTASEDGIVRTWDPVGGGARLTQRAHDGAVASVAVNASARMVASGGWDGKLHVWFARTGETALDVKLHDDIVVCVAVDKSGTYVATAGDDRVARIVHILSGEVRCERRDFRTGVKHIRFGEDGNVAVAGAWDGTFRKLTW